MTKTESNPMASTWTKAASIRRKFKAGPPRRNDLVYDCERAALQGYMLFLEIRKAMQAEIPTGAKDIRAALVLMTPENLVYLLAIPKLEGLPALSAKAMQLERTEKTVPVGVAVWQRDREAQEDVVWVQPWLVNPQAERAAREAQKAFKASEGKDTKISF